MFDDHLIVNELPARIRAELVLQQYSALVSRVPFFTGLHQATVVDICQHINQFAVMPGDTIIKRDDPYRELVIIVKGNARSIPLSEDDPEVHISAQALHKFLSEDVGPATVAPGSPHKALLFSDDDVHISSAIDEQVIEFESGAFFGEMEFLGLSDRHSMTVVALDFCEVATLDPDKMNTIIEANPKLHARLTR